MKIKLTPVLLVILAILFVTGHIGFLEAPLTTFMNSAGDLIGGSDAIGWSIILLTVFVRLILLPLMLHQQRGATIQQEKMRLLQPQLSKVQAAQKNARTQEEQMLASQAMMTIYRENNVSLLGGMNFATIIIQWPVFFGLYHAIRDAHGLANASFFGIDLASRNLWLAIATAVVYVVQSYLSMLGVPSQQRAQMRQMMLMMPVMMFFMTYMTNAGIGLYFFVGALFMVLQMLIITLWRPRLRRHVAQTFDVKDVADDALAGKIAPKAGGGAFAKAMQQAQGQAINQRKDVNATEYETDAQKTSNRERNSGKQQRK